MISIFISGRSEGTILVKYKIPTHGLLGLRNAILTASRGTTILNTVSDMSTRDLGSMVMLNLDF
jgi:GTP-binding protein